jgi:hypothetical protein
LKRVRKGLRQIAPQSARVGTEEVGCVFFWWFPVFLAGRRGYARIWVLPRWQH